MIENKYQSICLKPTPPKRCPNYLIEQKQNSQIYKTKLNTKHTIYDNSKIQVPLNSLNLSHFVLKNGANLVQSN